MKQFPSLFHKLEASTSSRLLFTAMSVLLLDQDDSNSEVAKFAREFATEKKKHLVTINASTFEDLKSRMDISTPLFVGDRSILNKDQDDLLKAIISDGRIPTIGHVRDLDAYRYTDVQVLWLSPKEDIIGIHLPTDDKTTESYMEQEMDLKSGKVKDGSSRISVKSELFGSTHSVEAKAMVKKTVTPVSDSLVEVDLKFPEYMITASIGGENEIHPSVLQPYCTLNISLSKAPPYKLIKFSTSDVGMIARSVEDQTLMGNDTSDVRGFFNDSANIFLIPGDGDRPHLPNHWHLEDRAPNTPNSKSMYVSTTGWSVGASAGASSDVMTGGEVSANVSLTYSKSNEVTTEIEDFSVRDHYNGSMSSWHFYYTDLDGKKKWKDHFTGSDFFPKAKSIANLAKSSLPLKTESVYRGPLEAKDKIKWTFCFEPNFRLLHVASWNRKRCYSLTLSLSATFTVDMENLEVILDS